MIVISCSLDSSLERAEHQGTLQADKARYSLFEHFGSVVLLTQDTKEFGKELGKIIHVPCAFSKFEIVRIFLSEHKFPRWVYFYFSSFRWLIRNRKKIGVVITENVNSPTPFLFSSLCGIPIYIHYHYDVATQVAKINKSRFEGVLLLFLEKLCFRKATCVWVTATSLAEKVKRFGAKRVTLLPNWYDFDRQPVKQLSEPSKSGHRLLFVGRLHPVKRVNLLLKAFANLRKFCPDASLNIIGDGDERQKLISLAKDLELGQSVKFLGFKNHETVLDIMSKADLLVLSSKMEGNPKVLIEAMMLRVPIVATNVPGIRDIIQNGKTGHLVNNDSSDDLAQAMDYVLGNRIYASTIAENAYEFAKNYFSKEQALKRVREDFLIDAFPKIHKSKPDNIHLFRVRA
jgi:glycosyltransferase involved in cell wall biosynthesis